ncbi:hypothetical protein A4A49_01293 [Nicotiana attenuata]|uniref:Uncharacterized protein n=1 Tax=Nicotiana attenuata TaxID=49451 RepID=A0A1J6ITE7_NICAT|nr:hypothetical protein A4A49_01293 [Nicotiana attenuata]
MLKRCVGDMTDPGPDSSLNLEVEDKVPLHDGSIVVTHQNDMEDTSYATLDPHNQQEIKVGLISSEVCFIHISYLLELLSKSVFSKKSKRHLLKKLQSKLECEEKICGDYND